MPGNIEVLTTRIVSFVYMGNDSGIRNATTLAVSLMILANGLLFFMTWFMGRKDYTTIGEKAPGQPWWNWENGKVLLLFL